MLYFIILSIPQLNLSYEVSFDTKLALHTKFPTIYHKLNVSDIFGCPSSYFDQYVGIVFPVSTFTFVLPNKALKSLTCFEPKFIVKFLDHL